MTKLPRDFSIDILRSCGLLLIILAHVSPPEWLFQLRTFDVPLMIFVSALSYHLAGKQEVSYRHYVISRLRRMVVPAWIFLTLFFMAISVFRIDLFAHFLTFKTIITSYLLLGGIGYVWIIQVFLLIALLSPLYVKLTRSLSMRNVILVSFVMVLIAAAINISVARLNSPLAKRPFSDIIIPALSYGAVFILGVNFWRMTVIHKWGLFMLFAIMLIGYEGGAYLLSNHFILPQQDKYPPSVAYIAWAIVVIFPLTFIAARSAPMVKDSVQHLIGFISANTMWIYLLHIPVVELMRQIPLVDNFLLRWIIAVVLPMAVFSLQKKTVSMISLRIKNPRTAKVFYQAFTG